MTITIDAAGRLVIPRKIRREAGLEAGAHLDVRCRDGIIEIEPKALSVALKRKGRLLVAFPRSTVATLRADTVERSRRDVAARRGKR